VIARAEHERAPDLRLDAEVAGGCDRPRLVEVADDDVCVEGAAARDDGAFRGEPTAAPVEHQIVVAAELVHVDDRDVVLLRAATEHLFATPVLARAERRGGEVDDDL